MARLYEGIFKGFNLIFGNILEPKIAGKELELSPIAILYELVVEPNNVDCPIATFPLPLIRLNKACLPTATFPTAVEPAFLRAFEPYEVFPLPIKLESGFC